MMLAYTFMPSTTGLSSTRNLRRLLSLAESVDISLNRPNFPILRMS